MEDNKILKLVYTFFLGILLAIFVGVGINTFYPGPKAPEYPAGEMIYDKEPTDDQRAKEREYETRAQQYREESKPYNRNVSIITLVSAVALLGVSLVYEKKIKVLADGVMLGGLFTLIYSIGRGFASEDSKYVFAMVTVGLAVVLYLGYHRFIRPHSESAKPPKKRS